MNNWLKVVGITFLIFLSIGCTDSENTDDAVDDIPYVVDKPSEYDRNLVRDYQIMETADDPWENAIKKEYRVLVPSDISKDELKSTLVQVVADETAKNNDIDAICVFAYDREEDVNSAYTLGTLDWCPNGNWGGVTSEIAKTNDRSSYEYVFNIKEKVGNLTVDKPTELEFEIYDYFMACCDAEWESIDLSDPNAYVDEDLVMQNVAEHYGITVEEVDQICLRVIEYKYQ